MGRAAVGLRRIWVTLLVAPALGLPGTAAAGCGDLDGDGLITPVDSRRLREALAGLPPPFTIHEEVLCNVRIDSNLPGSSQTRSFFDNDCTVLDSVVQRRAERGLPPGVDPVCPGGAEADCCTPHAGVGCADLSVTTCVCLHEPDCCASAWDMSCVDAVDALACGLCVRPSITRVEFTQVPDCAPGTPSAVTIQVSVTDPDSPPAALRFSGSVSSCLGAIDSPVSVVVCPQLGLYFGRVTVTDADLNSDSLSFSFGPCQDGVASP
ncbi:MAG: hypothetical protein ACE5FG_03245 [Myxococcota bacterium]